MMRIRLFLVLLCLTGHGVGAQALPKYDLAIALDFRSRRFELMARIAVPPAAEPRSSVSFALSELFPDPKIELRVSGAVVDSVHLEMINRPYSRPGWGTNTWRVTPNRPIPAGRPVTLVVSYHAAGDLKSFVFSMGDSTAFAAGQNTAWYPEIEESQPHPAGRLRGLRATGDLTFTVDTGVVVYTAASRRSSDVEGARRTLRYRVGKPMYLSFAAGPYIKTGPSYYLKRRSTARENGVRALRVLRVLEREFGRHPFERFAVVEVPAADADRAGFAGASADGFIMATTDFLDQPFNTAYYGHEIAHQWWGVTVRPTGARGIWMLSEAMAQFGSLRAVDAIDGPAAAERYRRDAYPGYLGQGGKLFFRVAAEDHDAPLADLPIDGEWSRPLADSKGFLAWNALSLEVGRVEFRRILSDIVTRYSTSRITWDDFLAQVSKAAGRDLSWFYAQWFDRAGVPEWRVATSRVGGAERAVLMQEPHPYRVSLRVDVSSARCRRATRYVVLNGEETVLPLLSPRCGGLSYAVDPAYEIIHWTPELRKEFSRRPPP